jgi:hypothetical protein
MFFMKTETFLGLYMIRQAMLTVEPWCLEKSVAS